MKTNLVTMSPTELDRAAHMQRIAERRATQAEVARQLGLSLRQVERMYRAYRRGGAAALASKRRGRPSNRRLSDAYRQSVMELVRAHYADFGPTLAREKLLERHDGLGPSLETLRKWMAEDGLWRTRKERRKRAQSPRQRRACVGELVQIDGCDHEWFEQRGPRCTLLVYVDDATSKLMELRFVPSESTFAYFTSTERYLQRYGKPVAFYSDRASIFSVNAKDAQAGDGCTQFSRAMDDLNIDVLCANSAAAKGRVERAHLTLQDRLVKELRLHGIDDCDAGNVFLEWFRQDYNRRFARVPRNERDAHRPLQGHEDLRRVFSWQETRRLTQSLTLHYKRVLYVVEATAEADNARGKRVAVREDEDGTVHIEFQGAGLLARAFPKDARVHQATVVDSKLLGDTLQQIRSMQHKRDLDNLEHQRMTLRERQILLSAMDEAGFPTSRVGDSSPADAKPSFTSVPDSRKAQHPLADVIAWAKQQARDGAAGAQPATTKPTRTPRSRRATTATAAAHVADPEAEVPPQPSQTVGMREL